MRLATTAQRSVMTTSRRASVGWRRLPTCVFAANATRSRPPTSLLPEDTPTALTIDFLDAKGRWCSDTGQPPRMRRHRRGRRRWRWFRGPWRADGRGGQSLHVGSNSTACLVPLHDFVGCNASGRRGCRQLPVGLPPTASRRPVIRRLEAPVAAGHHADGSSVGSGERTATKVPKPTARVRIAASDRHRRSHQGRPRGSAFGGEHWTRLCCGGRGFTRSNHSGQDPLISAQPTTGCVSTARGGFGEGRPDRQRRNRSSLSCSPTAA